MLIQSHKMISEYLHNNIQKHWGITLSKNYLIYGSIKPDLTPRLMKISHYPDESLDFLCNEIYRLASTPISLTTTGIKDLSIQLGVTTHFIADFFCQAHNNKQQFRNNLLEHLIYENALHGHFKNAYHLPTRLTKYTCTMNQGLMTIHDIFQDLMGMYINNGHGFENDIYYSLKATASITHFILHNALQSKRQSLSEKVA
ncbi:hypothetical protein HNQ80_004396 [Anaerosolibacter carboniphilus]|uniref:Phospholipase C/D domain-containing protein n=1 Tax=Anaerosolibacter carboniphilus TaxID=1417629 RepID=A0A841KY07_9FIRM|nr:zinc dependent phospholipase C family protein [Anaerosolibacter carboniphilus]MBB6218237.1 hypothetical protein [Anaerosolibacter carboniphilus]